MPWRAARAKGYEVKKRPLLKYDELTELVTAYLAHAYREQLIDIIFNDRRLTLEPRMNEAAAPTQEYRIVRSGLQSGLCAHGNSLAFYCDCCEANLDASRVGQGVKGSWGVVKSEGGFKETPRLFAGGDVLGAQCVHGVGRYSDCEACLGHPERPTAPAKDDDFEASSNGPWILRRRSATECIHGTSIYAKKHCSACYNTILSKKAPGKVLTYKGEEPKLREDPNLSRIIDFLEQQLAVLKAAAATVVVIPEGTRLNFKETEPG